MLLIPEACVNLAVAWTSSWSWYECLRFKENSRQLQKHFISINNSYKTNQLTAPHVVIGRLCVVSLSVLSCRTVL